MNAQDLKQHLDARLDRIETKLDDHLQRLTTSETDISWLKGHAKLSITIFVAALTGMVGALYEYLSK